MKIKLISMISALLAMTTTFAHIDNDEEMDIQETRTIQICNNDHNINPNYLSLTMSPTGKLRDAEIITVACPVYESCTSIDGIPEGAFNLIIVATDANNNAAPGMMILKQEDILYNRIELREHMLNTQELDA